VVLNTVFHAEDAYIQAELDQSNFEIDPASVVLTPTATEGSDTRAEADKLLIGDAGAFRNRLYAYLSLDPENMPKKGSYEFQICASLTDGTELAPKKFKVAVEDKVPAVKLKTATLKLNKTLNLGGSCAYAETAVSISSNPILYYTEYGPNYKYVLADMEAEAHPDIDVTYDAEKGMLRATLTDGTTPNGTYEIRVYPCIVNNSSYMYTAVRLEKPVTLKVQVYEGKPSVSVKASGKLDTIVPGSSITYTISKLTNIAGAPTDVRLEGNGAELFNANLNEEGNAVVTLRQDVRYQKDKSYKLNLVYTIAGREVAAEVTLKVTQSPVKFASLKPLNLYQSNSRLAVVLDMTAPEGAGIESSTLGSKTAKQFLQALDGDKGITFVELGDGTVLVSFKVTNPGYLSYGKSYTVYLDVTPEGNAENAKPTSVKLTVKTFK
jgi:hypothetical protein